MVGIDARMRVSSVMVDPSRGTLRSHRTSTLSRCLAHVVVAVQLRDEDEDEVPA